MNKFRLVYGNYPTIKVAKGETLYQQSEVPTKGYAIRRGVVKLSNINADGNEKIIGFKVADEVLPICWLFSKTTTALFWYQAHTDCELYVIDHADFERRIQHDQAFAQAVLGVLVNGYINTTLQIDGLVQTRANLKLLYAFRHLCLRYGKNVSRDHTKVQIPLTQQDLANYVGLTRETTTVELNRLKASGVIRYKNKYYSVDTSKLNDRIDDEYNPGVKEDLQTLAKTFTI